MNTLEVWGFIPLSWIKERRYDEFIAVEDIEAFIQMRNNIVERVGSDGDYLIVESDGYRGRLKPTIFNGVPRKPVAFLDEPVKFLNSKGALEYGIVKHIGWHDNDGHYLYSVEVNGKLKSRRYNENDIQKA